MRVGMIGWRGWKPGSAEGILAGEMAKALVRQGDIIISGNAPGFDQCCAAGGNTIDPARVHLHLPWPDFERQAIRSGNKVFYTPQRSMSDIGDMYDAYREREGSWAGLKPSTRALMARNVGIIMESERVVAAPRFEDGEPTGGTAFGIFLAQLYLKRLFIVDFNRPAGPAWDVCSKCWFQTNVFDCGAPIHSLKAYV